MGGFQRHVQTYQRIYMIIGLGAMIFSLFTFSVSSALYQLANEKGTNFVGSFKRSDGRVIEFPVLEYDRYRFLANSGLFDGFFETEKDQRAWEYKIWLEEAKLAGIQIPDDVLREHLDQSFKGLTSSQYIEIIGRYGFNSPGQFEETLRELLRIKELRDLSRAADVVTSEDIFQRFKVENALIKLDYVGFPFAKYSGTPAADQVTDEELKTYYASMNLMEKQRDCFTEEKVSVEAMYVDFGKADVAVFQEALVGMAEPTDEEIKRQYEASKQRYQVAETPAADQPATDPPKMRAATLDEAREQVKKDLRLKQVLEKAATDYRAAKAEAQLKAAPPETPPGQGAKPEDGAKQGEGENKGGPRQEPPPATPPPADAPKPDEPKPDEPKADEPKLTPAQITEELGRKFAEIAAKYHLEHKRFEGLKTYDELKALEVIGDENFPFFVRSLDVNDISPSRIPIEKQTNGYVLRVYEKEKAHERPLEEVREKVLASYLRSKHREAAEKAAKEFREALVAKARADAAAEIAPLEADAKKKAEERIAKEDIKEEDKRKAVFDEEQKRVEAQVTALIGKHLHQHFAEVAKDLGLTVEDTGYFRMSFYSSRLGQKMEAGAKKFLMSPTTRLLSADVDTVSEVLTDSPIKPEDADKGGCYVAMVADRKDPDISEMTPADRENAEREVWRTRQMNFRTPFPGGRKNPLAWFNLQQQFSIQEAAKKGDKPIS